MGERKSDNDDVKFYFENQSVSNRVNTAEKGHGRIEKREYFLKTDIDWLTQKDNSPLNWNVMRKTALPLIRSADIGTKTSLKRKMFIAVLDVSAGNSAKVFGHGHGYSASDKGLAQNE